MKTSLPVNAQNADMEILQNLARLGLEADTLNAIRTYADITGTTVQRCVQAGLDDWVFCCAKPRLQAFEKQPKLILLK